MIDNFQKFLNALDTGGGHVFLLSILTAVGVINYWFTRDVKVLELFGGALLLSMKGAKGN